MKLLSGSVPSVAWRCVVLILLLLGAAVVVLIIHQETGFLPGVVVQGVVGVLSLAAWMAAIRFILIDTWGRRFWLVVLAGAAALAAFMPGAVGIWTATPLSIFVLTFRQFRPWRRIADRRRALGFGMGVLATALLIFLLPRFWSLAVPHGPGAFLKQMGMWSQLSLVCFWLWSLFHLAVRMRLHFLRLRPKLGISAVLIGFIPLALMVLLGLMILYTGLGGARAARTSGMLENWRRMTALGADFGGALFDTTFVWPGPEGAGEGVTLIEAPGWVPGMAEKLQVSMVVPAIADSTGWFLAGGRIWLMRWRALDTAQPTVQAWHLGERPLEILSRLLKVGIDISLAGSSRENGGELVIGRASEEDQRSFSGLEVTYRDVSEDKGYWSRVLFLDG